MSYLSSKSTFSLLTRSILLFILFVLIFPLKSFSKDNAEEESFIIDVYFKDGTTINGYNRTNFVDGTDELEISTVFNGNAQKYKSELIDSIVFPPTESDSSRIVWIPFKAHKAPGGMKSIFSRDPFHKEPIFLKRVFIGKNIIGYTLPTTDVTGDGYRSQTYWLVNSYYITEPNLDYAYCYWKSIKGISMTFKAWIKKSFKQYPEMVQLFKDKTIKKQEFIDNPSIGFLYLDAIISKNTQHEQK